jgi:hypothetical protein
VADLSDRRMQELVDTLDCPDPDEVASMIDEIRRRRAASVCKYCDMGHREHRAGCPMLVLYDADRTALATAVRELKERRGTYETQLRRFQASGSDPAVIETWERAVTQVEEAIAVCERLAKGGGS